MKDIIINHGEAISEEELRAAVKKCAASLPEKLTSVLLLPPDYTRSQSFAGVLTQLFYAELSGRCRVDIMPALGTHAPMTKEERRAFFGDIPDERFFVHDWRHDVVKIGEIGADVVRALSDGKMDESIDVELNRRIVDGGYDAVISIGQVVPHEVAGMANYSKNLFVGCGGASMINRTHWLGAVCGLERAMGRRDTPVRRVFDLSQEMVKGLPLTFVLTVTEPRGGRNTLTGLFIGEGRSAFEEAARLSARVNVHHVERPFERVIVYLDPKEFKSTWLGNKAVYRTRMAIADGGLLVVLAPGVVRFGEDSENDRLIRKYGYRGTEYVLKMCAGNEDLAANRSAAAHLIHGSSEGRFRICYVAPKLRPEEITGVGFETMRMEEAERLYRPQTLADGYNRTPAGEVYYISNPALGLWACDKGDAR